MKSEQLQIRLTPGQKAALKRLAARAGQDVSQYVLSRVLPDAARRWEKALEHLATGDDPRFALAELHDVLASSGPSELASLPEAGVAALDATLRCRIAAMVEQACALA